MELTFIQAGASDIAEISKLINNSYRATSGVKGWTNESELIHGERVNDEDVLNIVKSRKSRIELGFNFEGLIVGCICMEEEMDNSCYISLLAVSPLVQNKGLGKLVLNQAEKICISSGYTQMRGTVIESRKELVDYYLRYGFKLTGKKESLNEKDKKGQLISLIEMVKPLS